MSSANRKEQDISIDGDEEDVSRDIAAVHPNRETDLSILDEIGSIEITNAPYSTGLGPTSEFEKVGSIELPLTERTTAIDRATVGRVEGDLQAGTILYESDIEVLTGDSTAREVFASETHDIDVRGNIEVRKKDPSDERNGTEVFKRSNNPLVTADRIEGDHLDRNSYGGLLVAEDLDVNNNHGNMVTISSNGEAQKSFPTGRYEDIEDFQQKIWENRDDIYGIPLLNPDSLEPEEVTDQDLVETSGAFENRFFRREVELQQIFDEEVENGTPGDAVEVLGDLGGLNGLEERRYAGLIDQALTLEDEELDRFSSLEKVLTGRLSDLEEDEWKGFVSRMSDEALLDFSQKLPEGRPDYDTTSMYRNVVKGVLNGKKPLQDISVSTPLEDSVFRSGYRSTGEVLEEAYNSLDEEAGNLSFLAEFAGEEQGLGLEQLAEDYRNGEIDPDDIEDVLEERLTERTKELTEKAVTESEFLENFIDKVLAETPDGEYQLLISDKSSDHHGSMRLKDTALDSEEAVEQIVEMRSNRQLEGLELFDIVAEDTGELEQKAAGLARVHSELEEHYELFQEFKDEYDLDENIDFNTTNDQIVKQLTSIEDDILEAQQERFSTEDGELDIIYEELEVEEKRDIITDLEEIADRSLFSGKTKDRKLLNPLKAFDVEASGHEELIQKLAGMSRSMGEISGNLEDSENYREKFESVDETIDFEESNDQIIKQLRDLEETVVEGLSSGEMSRDQAERLVNSDRESYLLRQKEEIDSTYGSMGEFLDEFVDGAASELVENPEFEAEYFMSGENISQSGEQAAGEAYQEGLSLLERVAHGGGNFELDEEYRDDSIEEIEEELQEVGQKLSESEGRPDQELIDTKNTLKEKLAFRKRKTVFEDLGVDYADSPEEEQELDADYFESKLEDPGELRSTMSQIAQEFMSNSEDDFQPNSEVARDLYSEASNIEVGLNSESGHLKIEAWEKNVEDIPGPVNQVPCVLPGGPREEGVLHYMEDPGTQILKIDSVQGEGVAINNIVEHDGDEYLFVHSVESEDNLTASEQYSRAIKNGIEEYAEELGVDGLIYNTDVHNEAPGDFTDNLEKIDPELEETTVEVDKKGEEDIDYYLDTEFPEVDGYVQKMQA